MSRRLFLFILVALLLLVRNLPAQNDGPPISITSPDVATTFAYGTVKHHALIWNKKEKVLIARVTFTDVDQSSGQSDEDTHEFRLPGVSFNEAKGIFQARSATGEVIPVAHLKKGFLGKSIETTSNAVVRVVHPRGNVTVILEAISPDDPTMHLPAGDSGVDGPHDVDIDKILN